MRSAAVLLISAFVCAGQIPPQQAPLLRGILVDRDAAGFSVRTPGDQIVRYRFDARTYVEREEKMIDVPGLRAGEQVEVLSDLLGGSSVRYARTIHVIYPIPPRRNTVRPRPEPLSPRADMTFSGVVSQFNDGRLVLRTRTAGELTIQLRKDTRFLADGETVAATDLKTNMRVFVQAGKDVFGHVEVYQVVWGGILQPK